MLILLITPAAVAAAAYSADARRRWYSDEWRDSKKRAQRGECGGAGDDTYAAGAMAIRYTLLMRTRL